MTFRRLLSAAPLKHADGIGSRVVIRFIPPIVIGGPIEADPPECSSCRT